MNSLFECGCEAYMEDGEIEMRHCPLHAAASELLAEMKRIAACLSEYTNDAYAERHVLHNWAVNAIAKAEGKS